MMFYRYFHILESWCNSILLLLGFVCISDVDVSLTDRTINPPLSSKSKLLSRKKSISFVSPLPTTPAVKKGKVFFNNDADIATNTVSSSTSAAVSTENATLDARTEATQPSKKPLSPVPAIPTNIITRSCFVLNFGDHSYQMYGICLRFPVTFHDVTNDVIVKSVYVICFMSTFSLFSYFFNILDNLEMNSTLLQFSEPLAEWKEINLDKKIVKLHKDLQRLQELAIKLSRIRPPHYPHLGCFDARSATDFNVEQMIALNRNSEFQKFDVVSILPDIHFNCVVNNPIASVDDTNKIQFQRKFSFLRSQYQSLYSKFSVNHSDNSKVDDMMLKCNKNAESSSYIIMRDQKAERESENHTLILLWALPTLLKFFKLDQITLALGCIVSEMKIIVLHKDIQVVSSIIFALLNLISPLKWYGQVIITVPDSLSDLLGK